MDAIPDRDFTLAQRREYTPPRCPNCGSANTTPTWAETTDGDERTWRITLFDCNNCHGIG